LVAAFGVWLFCGSALWHPFTRQATSIASEGPGHLWGLWLATLDIPHSGGLMRHADVGWPGHFDHHLMDPVNLLIFAPGYVLGGGGLRGASLGWNLLHAVAPVVAAWSSWRLTRRLVGESPALPWAGLLAALTFVVSPYFALHPETGRTEFLPASLYPAHLAFLHAWLRRPAGGGSTALEPEPPVRVAVGAALTLAAVALGGWYLAVFVAFTEIGLAAFWTRGLQRREALRRLLVVAVPAIVLTLPAAYALLVAGPPVDYSGATVDLGRCQPLALLVRMTHAGRQVGLDYGPYIGLLPLLALGVAAWRRPRTDAAWAAVGLTCLLIGLGPRITWSTPGPDGCLTGWPGPLALLTTLVPPLNALRACLRINVVVSALASGAVAVAVADLWPRLGRQATLVALALAALLLADHLTYPGAAALVPPTFDARAPARLGDALAAIPSGPVVTYPTDTTLHTEEAEEHGLWSLWQLQSGRPISGGSLGSVDPTIAWNALTQAVVQRVEDSAAAYPGSADRSAVAGNAHLQVPHEPELSRLRMAAVELRISGYRGVVLVEDMEGGGDLRSLLYVVLGPPQFDGGGVVSWNLDALRR
jgi:hypothetical protein